MAYVPCPPAVVNEAIAEVFDPPLFAARFEKATPRKYVRARVPHTRDVIELHSDYIRVFPVWGLSLEFVPHVSGRDTETVKWHRTARSADPDLRYCEVEDPSRGFRPKFAIPTIEGRERLEEACRSARVNVLPRAMALFEAVSDLRDIDALFQHEERVARWGTFWNQPQVSLAYSFYLAKMGREPRRAFIWRSG